MHRSATSAVILAVLTMVLLVACQGAQDAEAERAEVASMAGEAEAQTPPRGSTEWKIQNAMSAAPPELAGSATIMDWPETEDGEMRELRAGTNGWTCMPSTPEVFEQRGVVEDPMCLDEPWLAFISAWVNREEPRIETVGLGYMLRGDGGASNTDPFATGPTPDNEWVQTGPHLMVIVPDVQDLEGISSDPSTGGPWVMYRGTPYAHIMVPVPGPH